MARQIQSQLAQVRSEQSWSKMPIRLLEHHKARLVRASTCIWLYTDYLFRLRSRKSTRWTPERPNLRRYPRLVNQVLSSSQKVLRSNKLHKHRLQSWYHLLHQLTNRVHLSLHRSLRSFGISRSGQQLRKATGHLSICPQLQIRPLRHHKSQPSEKVRL